MAIKQLSDGGPDGTLLGQDSSDKIGFYGLTTPVAKQTVTSVTTTTATTALNETRIGRLEAALSALGLISMS
jgi:hypothetical protein